MRKILIYVLVLVSLTACSKKNYEVKTIDGVRTVINPEMLIEPFSLEKDMTIPVEGEGYLINNIEDIAFDKVGNIYVLDSRECNIKKFDPDGNLTKIFSHKGNGPGELYSPGSIFITDRNEILIREKSRGIIHSFDLEGNYKMQYKMENFLLRDLVSTSDSAYICSGKYFGQTEDLKNALYTLDSNLKVTKSFYPVSDVSTPIALVKFEDRVILSQTTENRIDILKNENTELSIKRHLYIEGVIKKIGHGTLVTSSSRCLETDSNGNIYTIVPTYDYQKANKEEDMPESVLQVFSKDGVQIKNMALDENIFYIAIDDNDYIYTYHYNTLNITRYKPIKI